MAEQCSLVHCNLRQLDFGFDVFVDLFLLCWNFAFLVAFVTRTSLLRGDQLSMSKEIHYSSYMHEQESV